MKKIMIICTALLSLNAFARDGSSGCGPGWYIAKDNSILSSSLRSTTNGILAPTVTFGMTFGTSNCAKHSIVKNEREDLKFSTENYYEIAADTAKGNGKFLNAYADLMGCEGVAKTKFKAQMQRNFQQLFQSLEARPEQLLEETYKVILRDGPLRTACFSA